MKFHLLTLLLATSSVARNLAPRPDARELSQADFSPRDASPLEAYNPLEKRKGGGGGRGGGGGGKGGGSGSSGSGGRPLSSYSFSPTSNAGGRTRHGSGTSPAYGTRYAGGAAVPYTAGARSPTRGIAPFAFPLAGFAIFPGLWLYGSLYAYPYGYGYHWYQDGQNRTSNVTCLCQRYQVCGCDPQGNSTLLNQEIANGTGGAPVNSSTVRTVTYENGTTMSYINGSLANGTTAPGGTEPSNATEAGAVLSVAKFAGYWVMIVFVVAAVTV